MCLNPKDPEAHRVYTEGGGMALALRGAGRPLPSGPCRRPRPHGREARMRLWGRRGVADPHAGAGERERRPRGRDRGELTNE